MRPLPLLLLLPALLGAAPVQVVAPAAPTAATAADTRPQLLLPRIVARFPHDRSAFTEGLIFTDNALFESVGREGVSEVRRVRLEDGRIMARAAIPAAQFGEGLARWGDQLISLTWHDGVAHRWALPNLKKAGEGRFPGEGWGLASETGGLIESDGSATLKRFDPKTLRVTGKLAVTIDGRPLDQLNELEVVDGQILANVWRTPWLVRIDPVSGKVTAVVDLRAIVAEVNATDPEAVANGIAWDAKGRRLFVTGKLWPTVFEVKLEPRA
ncbi:glutaminyl-peptide cyclotransferase [Sphingomonas sp. MA1305]|uniref:glutaminyl-peptide cyclotransferase n=1 Tax=Sphingomonas sp. MA1305 TaxID=2479204 RepID=UPI0018E02BC4|nr:glutaminyl-peptide cyclotransferase [Sphingomonas sp. MA1305]MBI0476009.1 glutaminyl-peptide cyclotransferase [Sphingomonas sp. MA1305]